MQQDFVLPLRGGEADRAKGQGVEAELQTVLSILSQEPLSRTSPGCSCLPSSSQARVGRSFSEDLVVVVGDFLGPGGCRVVKI